MLILASFGADSPRETYDFDYYLISGVDVNSCFISAYEMGQKLVRTALEQLQTLLSKCDSGAFVINHEKKRHPHCVLRQCANQLWSRKVRRTRITPSSIRPTHYAETIIPKHLQICMSYKAFLFVYNQKVHE